MTAFKSNSLADRLAGSTKTKFHSTSSSPLTDSDLAIDDGISLDTRRLRAQHITEGYREGITAGKAENIQAGFDEGFHLGANVGLRAGRVLGLLEGITSAFEAHAHPITARFNQLLCDARNDLAPGTLFSEAYWSSDGVSKYSVKGSNSDDGILFEDVAHQHPLILKWMEVISQETLRWSLDQTLPVFSGDEPQPEEVQSSAGSRTSLRLAVDW